jgi:hypothetical protein
MVVGVYIILHWTECGFAEFVFVFLESYK